MDSAYWRTSDGRFEKGFEFRFLNDEDINDDKWDLEREDRFWAQDFENFIYKHKESHTQNGSHGQLAPEVTNGMTPHPPN